MDAAAPEVVGTCTGVATGPASQGVRCSTDEVRDAADAPGAASETPADGVQNFEDGLKNKNIMHKS